MMVSWWAAALTLALVLLAGWTCAWAAYRRDYDDGAAQERADHKENAVAMIRLGYAYRLSDEGRLFWGRDLNADREAYTALLPPPAPLDEAGFEPALEWDDASLAGLHEDLSRPGAGPGEPVPMSAVLEAHRWRPEHEERHATDQDGWLSAEREAELAINWAGLELELERGRALLRELTVT
jgi:hypothetical protein